MELSQALEQLDPAVDDHWTSNGLPRMDAVQAIAHDSSITRAQITAADPMLNRESAAGRRADAGVPAAAPPVVEESSDAAPAADPAPATPLPPAAPAENASSIPAEGSVLDKPIPEVLANYELCLAASGEIDEKIAEALEQKKQLEEELAQLNGKNDLLVRAITVHERRQPKAERGRIQAYLETQRKARAEKVERARAFIAAGTTAKDVVAELASTSKLDAAMNQRKAARGSKRPATRVPQAS